MTGPLAIGFEHHERKITELGPTALAMSAGNALISTDTITRARRGIPQNGQQLDVRQVSKLLENAYIEVHMERAEQTFLIPRGWTLAEFKEKGANQIPLQVYGSIDQQFWNFFLNTDFIVAGVDPTGAHIAWVHYNGVASPGWLDWYDKIGYHAIGSGASHAAILLSLSGQHAALSAAETVYNVFRAKRNAEIAPGVGHATDMAVVTKAGIEFLTEASLGRLEKLKARAEAATADKTEIVKIYDERAKP